MGYNRVMGKSEHSRRDFLQGKAAMRTLVSSAREIVEPWVDAVEMLLPSDSPADSTIHIQASRRAMACEFAVKYHALDHRDDLFLAAFELIEEIESLLTVYQPRSAVIEINQSAAKGPVVVNAELFSLIELSQRLFYDTAGAFDITSTPLSRVWGFFKRAGHLPSESEIADALEHVDGQQIELNLTERSVRFLRPGIEINFNSIGKGHALDRVAQRLEEQGASDYLWHGGSSSVLARGSDRSGDRSGWTIGLRHPLQPELRVAEIRLQDRALGTSGGATQFFEREGRHYGHVLDPRTGWPASGVFAATAIAPSAAEADALATAFYVLGPEGSARYCAERPDVGAVLVTPAPGKEEIEVHAFNLGPEDWTPASEVR
mgnify:FL=1